MAFVAKVGVSYADSSDFLTNAIDGLHAVLQAAGWSVLEELDTTPGQEDRVYSSPGEAGDEVLFLRVTHSQPAQRLYFRAYSFWDVSTSTGYVEVGDGAGATAIQLGITITGWIAVDADGMALVAKVGTDYNKFVAARLVRAQPYDFRGRTTLAAPIPGSNTAGDSQLYVAGDTDFTGFAPDQKLWVVNQDMTSGFSAELVEVASVDAANRLLGLNGALTNSFGFGALVAQVPQPLVLWGDLNGKLEQADPYGLGGPDGHTARVKEWVSTLSLFPVALDDYGNLPSGDLTFQETAVTKRHVFGSLQNRVAEVPLASVADEDTLQLGGGGSVVFTEVNRAFSIRVS